MPGMHSGSTKRDSDANVADGGIPKGTRWEVFSPAGQTACLSDQRVVFNTGDLYALFPILF